MLYHIFKNLKDLFGQMVLFRQSIFKNSSKFAFTLAEVLITLGVIGIVAALTLPAVIGNYQKHVTVEKLKKVYSTLGQAMRLSEAQNGFMNDWNIDMHTNIFEVYLKPYLNVVDFCYLPDCNKRGIHFGQEGNKYRAPAGAAENDFPIADNHAIYVLADGTMLFVYPSLHNAYYIISRIYVDLNGNKGPNRMGRDLFSLLLLSESTYGNSDIADTIIVRPGIYFEGFGQTREDIKDGGKYYTCRTTGHGLTCGALIQMDGWKIKDDYPW